MPRAEVLALFGPTAVGKSALAHAAALELNAEIVVADPFQRYRGLEIAADAPSHRERAEVHYHFVGDLDLSEGSSAGEFADLADRRLAEIQARGRLPIVAGGSGLYVQLALAAVPLAPAVPAEVRRDVEALVAQDPEGARSELERRDPRALERVDEDNPRRLTRALELARMGRERADALWSAPRRRPTHLVGVTRPREHLYERIRARVERELADGLVPELERATATPGFSKEAAQIIGVKELRQLQRGEITVDDLPERLTARTKTLARRQLTWLRKMPLDRTIDLGVEEASSALSELVSAMRTSVP